MVHPFERVLSDNETDKPDAPQTSRRALLKLAAGGAVAAAAGQVAAQAVTTMAIGEEGGNKKPIVGRVPGKSGDFSAYSRNVLEFRTALRAGDIETAASKLTELESASKTVKSPRHPYKQMAASCRRGLDAALTAKLKRADKDLADKKLVPAIKAYRVISRIDGFKQQDSAKSKLADAAKLDGYAEALDEVKAQELYDTAAGMKKNSDKLAVYQQTAKEYGKTPTGKKAAKQAKTLAAKMKRDEAAAGEMLKTARKSKASDRARLLKSIVNKYPDTPSGEIAARMLPKKPPRPIPPRNGPVATTMAIGEEG